MKKTSYFNEKGYSLVEVLAVIVILGIIASIGLVSVSKVMLVQKTSPLLIMHYRLYMQLIYILMMKK